MLNSGHTHAGHATSLTSRYWLVKFGSPLNGNLESRGLQYV